MTVRIVSYNLLLPIYVEQTEFLKTDYQWKVIQNQLEQEIVHHENTIICVQELSLAMLPKLELFFRRLKYSFFNNLYGVRSKDYMGIGMAIPLSMELNDISYIKIGDHIRTISTRRENTSADSNKGTVTEVMETAPDLWETAMERNNTLICLKLTVDGQSLCVGTYHMPCLFKISDVITIHSFFLKDLMFQLVTGNNCILAGNCNFEPGTGRYSAFTEKDYLGISFPKSNRYNISYEPKPEQMLKSALPSEKWIRTNFYESLLHNPRGRLV